eukprot:TRINITY_DN24767_c0_g1_i2.p1 TRINITY_DN24767_c0_g1~~TRINITY_DN24767_c0_g1_i2.p1  ORF type:complete len:489 (+),score=90.32 TRINITY_DN24767_c0_g1_i2:213-1469(+)
MGGTVGEDFARMMAQSGLADESQMDGFRRELGDIEGLFDAIKRWALEALNESGSASFASQLEVWKPGQGSKRVVYSAAQCRNVLANALLLNVEDTTIDIKTHGGGLSFADMLAGTNPIASEKLACLLQYFDASRALEGSQDCVREVIFELRSASEELADVDSFHRWALEQGKDLSMSSNPVDVLLHEDGMEVVEDADAFVNFANAEFGYGCFIPSCTQEEILQMCCPEFNVGMLHVGRMLDEEVVVVQGVRRFSAYSGYGATFEYAGPWTRQPSLQTILTMDASTSGHYRQESVLRDVRKAYLAFSGSSVVSSGRWGCGAFGGSPPHKFAQQVVASWLARCSLRFSTFGDAARCDEILAAIEETRPSADVLLKAVLLASAAKLAGSEGDFVLKFAAVLKDLTREVVAENSTRDAPLDV